MIRSLSGKQITPEQIVILDDHDLGLSGSHVEALAEVFQVLDEDGDGHIDINELKNGIQSAEELMRDSDKNGDGSIDFDGK